MLILMFNYLMEIKKIKKPILQIMMEMDTLMDKITSHPHKSNLNIRLIMVASGAGCSMKIMVEVILKRREIN